MYCTFSGTRVSSVRGDGIFYTSLALILFSSRCVCFLNWPFCVCYNLFRCWVARYSHIFAAFREYVFEENGLSIIFPIWCWLWLLISCLSPLSKQAYRCNFNWFSKKFRGSKKSIEMGLAFGECVRIAKRNCKTLCLFFFINFFFWVPVTSRIRLQVARCIFCLMLKI